MISLEQYNKLKVKESVQIFSQTEQGMIEVCSKEDWNLPIFKWENTYFKITKDLPSNKEELKNLIIFGSTDVDFNKLYLFLTSKNRYGFTNFTVFHVCKIAWIGFYPGYQF